MKYSRNIDVYPGIIGGDPLPKIKTISLPIAYKT